MSVAKWLLIICLCPFICYSEIKVAIIADSIGTPYHLSEGKQYPALLQAKYEKEGKEVRIINDSIGGSTTEGSLDRLQKLIEEEMPHILVIGLGTNDGGSWMPIHELQSNLEELIQLALSYRMQVFIGEVDLHAYSFAKNTNYNRQFAAIYSRLAEKYPIILFPYLTEGFIKNSSYTLDGVHPNEKGHEILAKRLKYYLDRSISPFARF